MILKALKLKYKHQLSKYTENREAKPHSSLLVYSNMGQRDGGGEKPTKQTESEKLRILKIDLVTNCRQY